MAGGGNNGNGCGGVSGVFEMAINGNI